MNWTLALFSILALPSHVSARDPMFLNQNLAPKEVVTYFVERMTQGDYQIGILDREREAFTEWKASPIHNDTWVVTEYKIHEPQSVGLFSKFVKIRVEFKIKSVADAHGTFMPAHRPKKTVDFHLKRIENSWKIVSPSHSEWEPYILESHFPYANF